MTRMFSSFEDLGDLLPRKCFSKNVRMFIANGQSGLIKLRWYRCDTNVVNELNENDDAQGRMP